MFKLEPILSAITSVENDLTLIENLIQNILIFDLPEGNFIVTFRFQESNDYDPSLIGGLSATIQEFSGDRNEDYVKSINLDQIKLLFLTHENFIILFVVDPNYPDSQFTNSIFYFRESFAACLSSQDYGNTMDGAAISAQTIYNLISEEIQMEIDIGSKVSIYPFKLRELAEKTAKTLLGADYKTSKTDLYDDTEMQDEAKSLHQAPISKEEALNQLLSQFLSTFTDVSQVTLIQTTIEGTFDTYAQSRLSEEIQKDLYDTVMGMIDTVSLILDSPQEERVIDLDERLIYFHKVSDYSFIYAVVEDKDSGELIWPIVERMAKSIVKLLPEDEEALD